MYTTIIYYLVSEDVASRAGLAEGERASACGRSDTTCSDAYLVKHVTKARRSFRLPSNSNLFKLRGYITRCFSTLQCLSSPGTVRFYDNESMYLFRYSSVSLRSRCIRAMAWPKAGIKQHGCGLPHSSRLVLHGPDAFVESV